MAQQGQAATPAHVQRIVPGRSLWIGNLPLNITVERLLFVFGQYCHGKKLGFVAYIENAWVFGGSASGNPFAVVTFSRVEAAREAKAELTGKRVALRVTPSTVAPQPKDIVVQWALTRPTLMLRNLLNSVIGTKLVSTFSQFGQVKAAGVDEHPMKLWDGSPHRTGRGWVTFTRRYTAALVLDMCSEGMLIEAGSPCPVGVSQPDLPSAHRLRGVVHTPPSPSTDLPPVPAHFAAPGTVDMEFALEQRALAWRQEVEMEDLLLRHKQRQYELLGRQQLNVREAKRLTDQCALSESQLREALRLTQTARETATATEREAFARRAALAEAQAASASAFTEPEEDVNALMAATSLNQVIGELSTQQWATDMSQPPQDPRLVGASPASSPPSSK